jgi:LysM repeat protein
MAITYTVKKGDTLSAIAAKAGISLKQLIDLNPQIKNKNLINPGQNITISEPTPAKGASANAIIQQYTDAASGNEYLKGRYGPGSGLTAPGTTATQAASVTATPVVPVAPATATATVKAIPVDKSAATKALLEKAIADKLAADKIAADKLAADKAAADKIAAELKIKQDQEAAVAAALAAQLAITKAEQDAKDATTAAQIAAAEQARIQAEAALAAANAATAASAAAASTNINQTGNTILPLTSPADEAAALYDKEQKAKAEQEKILAERRSVSDVLTDRFKQYGLESLVGAIRNLAIEGASEATITLALQETPEYKERFRANEARIKANLRVLSPSEYLKNEDAYRLTLREYGLNKYDTDEYVTKFIENDTAPEELSGRIALGVNRIQNADPLVLKTLRAYGVTDTDMLEYVLDTKNKLPEITRKVQIAEIGAAARAQGLNVGTTEAEIAAYKATSEALANQGVDQTDAQKGYSAIAGFLPEAEKLSGIYSNMEGYGQTQAEQEVFGKMASAKRAREALKMQEIAAFSGSAGTTKGSLGSKATGQI